MLLCDDNLEVAEKPRSHRTKYTYDDLNRLKHDDTGPMNTSTKAIKPSGAQLAGINDTTEWELDALGNPLTLDRNGTADWYKSNVTSPSPDINRQNQLIKRRVYGKGSSGYSDGFWSSTTASNWDKPGSGDSFDVATTTNGRLTIGTVNRDTIDGSLEPAAQVLLVTAGPIGPAQLLVNISAPPGTSSGEMGYVFGYKSGADYWQRGYDFASGNIVIYHVVNGTRTLIHSEWGWGVPYFIQAHGKPGRLGSYGNTTLTDGYPSGRVGLYSTISGSSFGSFAILDDARHADSGGRWQNHNAFDNSITTNDRLDLTGYPHVNVSPIVLKGLRLQKFQATFSVRRLWAGSDTSVKFVFDVQSPDAESKGIWIPHKAGATAPHYLDGWVAGTAFPALANSDVLWVRIECTGTSVTLKAQVSASEPSDGSWSGLTAYLTKNPITATGGNIGFLPGDWNAAGIDDLTVKSDADNNGSYETTEVVETFDVDANGYTETTLTYDHNGNLKYDGLQAYTYDAWNRLKTVAHAYQPHGTSTVNPGRTFATMGYDAAGRRITKLIEGTGVDDCEYNYYLSGNSVVEEQNGSDQSIKDHVWGTTYIDEAVQTRVHHTLSETNPSLQVWHGYWHLQDANFNELGVVSSTGSLVERYEYAAYGARSVYYSAGANDPGCYAPSFGSRKVVIGGANQPWGINEVGHQGLIHDEQSSLVYNRARHLNPGLGRFMQQDPMGYTDGPNLYASYGVDPIGRLDPIGGTYNLDKIRQILNDIANGINDATIADNYQVPVDWVRRLRAAYNSGLDERSINDLIDKMEQAQKDRESACEKKHGTPTLPPCDPKDLQKIDDNWLKKNGIDAHSVKDGYPQGDLFYNKKTGKVYFSPKGVKPNCDEALGTLADLAKQHPKE